MSDWAKITGVINIEYPGISEFELLMYYQRYAHALKGSEGGLHIDFTNKESTGLIDKKTFKYTTNTVLTVDTMVISRSLRDTDAEKVKTIQEVFKAFLEDLADNQVTKNAVITTLMNTEPIYYNINLIDEEIYITKNIIL